jgi:hypothetical protein
MIYEMIREIIDVISFSSTRAPTPITAKSYQGFELVLRANFTQLPAPTARGTSTHARDAASGGENG